jgi:hypothetical protein
LRTFNIPICYTQYMEITDQTIDVLLGALADQLQALGCRVEIVVIGGSALTALGLVRRATRDVDLLAIAENGELRLAEPLRKPSWPHGRMSQRTSDWPRTG